jgi:dTDP-4-dehydrorhamnose reductase
VSRLLVLGGNGMLGHKLVHVLGSDPRHEVHATVRRPIDPPFAHPAVTYHTDIDLSPASGGLASVLGRVRPDVVINAAGAIKQKDLEATFHESFFMNATLPHLIPLLADGDVRVVHFSTDCVFRGDRGGYSEADRPDVEDLYGRSKACGELDYGRHLTIRSSIIGFELGAHLGLLAWLFSQPRCSTLRGFRRAIYSGLPTCTLARTVAHVLVSYPDLTGLYHVASTPISKLDLLERVSRAFDLGHSFVPDDDVAIDRSLDDTRFRTATTLPRPDWDSLVAELVADYESLPYADIYEARANVRFPIHGS